MSETDSGTEVSCESEKTDSTFHDDDTSVFIFDLEDAPPKIQPFSGVLEEGRTIIRPVAFKPTRLPPTSYFVFQGDRYGSAPTLSKPGLTRRCHHMDPNFEKEEKSGMLLEPSTMVSSFNSLPQRIKDCNSLESIRKSPASNPGSTLNSLPRCGSLLDLTSSPSDSGISDLEAALRDRDSELANLRQTMEHNEQVIVRVYQEKEKLRERELRRLKNIQETRLRASAQKIMKLEQLLMMQTHQLQQEKENLREETRKAKFENSKLRKEVKILKDRLEETEWNLCQKTGELSLLKSQIKDNQNEQRIRGREIFQLKTELQQLNKILKAKDMEIEYLRGSMSPSPFIKTPLSIKTTSNDEEKTEISSPKKEKEKPSNFKLIDSQSNNIRKRDFCRNNPENATKSFRSPYPRRCCSCAEISKLVEEINLREKNFEKERITWAQEKEKVLKYQKQLQMNYMQMFKKTKTLEDEIQNLTTEIKSKKTTNKNKYSTPESLQTIEL